MTASGFRTFLALLSLAELAWRLLDRRPAAPTSDVSALQGELERLVAAQDETCEESQAIRAALGNLEAEVGRGGRALFKATMQAESLQQRIERLLPQAQAAENLRQREVEQLRQQLVEVRERARMELIERLLPIVDGLEEAVASAARQFSARENGDETRRRWPVRLFSRTQTPESQSRKAQKAWLQGLQLVRQRLTDLLEAEGVRPMAVEGARFDANHHVVVDWRPCENASAEGMIVACVRRGYFVGDSVLRYAEVVVARSGA